MLSLSVVIMLALCTALATLLTLSRFGGLRVVLKYAAVVDIVFTITLMFLFAGTLGGMLVAVMAGLFLSIFLTAAKWVQRAVNDTLNKVDPNSEYDSDGQWIYNTDKYI